MQGVRNRNISTKHLVKGMLVMRDVSLTKLAEELNRKFGYTFTQSNLSRKLNSDTMKWSELRDIAMLVGDNIRITPVDDWESIENTHISQERSAGLTTIL